MPAEKFVDPDVAADYLGVKRRRLLDMRRAGMIRGYPFGGGKRKTWRFKLSELDEDMAKLAKAAQKGNEPNFSSTALRRASNWRR
jgi:excisionase family DNA binding protein